MTTDYEEIVSQSVIKWINNVVSENIKLKQQVKILEQKLIDNKKVIIEKDEKHKQKILNSKPYYCCYCDIKLKYGSKFSHNKGIIHIKKKNNFENRISKIFSKKLNIEFIKEEKTLIKNKQCIDCKKLIYKNAIRCISCATKKSIYKYRKWIKIYQK